MGYLKQTLIYSAITLLVIVAGLSLYKISNGDIQSKPKDALVYPEFKTIAPFKLVLGEKDFTEQDLKKKWSFLFFGYTFCPDVCPTTMSALKAVYQQLPEAVQKDTQVVLVSIDPDRDSPDILQQYAAAFEPSFIGVTADHKILKAFNRSFGVIYAKVGESSENYLVDHTARIFLIDPDGRRHAIFQKSMSPTEGYEFNIEQMVNDYLTIRRNF